MFDDLKHPNVLRVHFAVAREAALHNAMPTAFPAEMEEERLAEDVPTLDDVVVPAGEVSSAVVEGQGQAELDQQLLEEIPLPRVPTEEAERRQQGAALPRPVRAAIRRCHEGPGTCSEQGIEGYAEGKPVSDTCTLTLCPYSNVTTALHVPRGHRPARPRYRTRMLSIKQLDTTAWRLVTRVACAIRL